MGVLDWLVVACYFVVMVGIGLWAKARILEETPAGAAAGAGRTGGML